MRPLWLELMLTPMAAPETRRLRAMRLSVVAGCFMVALGCASIGFVGRMLGRPGVAVLACLTIAVALLVAAYAVAKMRADAAYLDRLGEDDQ